MAFLYQKIKSVTLNAVDCQFNAITEGYAIIDNSVVISIGLNGKLSVPIPCKWANKNFYVKVFDTKKKLYGKIMIDKDNFSGLNNSNVLVCTDGEEFVEINYNGKTTKYNQVGHDGDVIYVVNDTIVPNPILPISYFFSLRYYSKIKDFGTSGPSPNNDITEVFFQQENMTCDTSCLGKINITKFGTDAGIFDATFNFTYKGQPVTGKIKVRD